MPVDPGHAATVVQECRRLAVSARHPWSTTEVMYGWFTAGVAGWARREVARRGASRVRGASQPAVFQRLLAIEAGYQADIVRDIFGNPFKPTTIDNILLTPAVLSTTQSVYNNRAFDRVFAVADALADAGADDDSELLRHLRGPGPHCRGCWGVDVVLGKS